MHLNVCTLNVSGLDGIQSKQQGALIEERAIELDESNGIEQNLNEIVSK